MFCRYCGAKIHEDSIFCSSCGKRLVPEETAVSVDAAFKSDPEFVWNVDEFPEHKQTGDIDFTWTETKETDDETEMPHEEAETPHEEVEMLHEQDSKIEKFYTFSKKNEEFQKLLDKEYERVKSIDFSEDDESSDDVEDIVDISIIDDTEDIEEIEYEEEKTTGLIFDNDTLSKKFDTKEFNKDLIESALEKAGILTRNREPEQQKSAYESDFRPRFIEDFGEEDDLKPEIIEEIPPEKPEEIPPEKPEEPENPDVEEPPAVDPQKQEAFRALEELWDSHGHEQKGRAKSGYKAAFENEGGVAEKEMTREEMFSDNDSGKVKRKGKAGKVFLIILLVLLAFEVSILVVRNLAPESAAANFINEKLYFATMWMDGGRQNPVSVEDETPTDPFANIDREPAADKTALIAGQLRYNKNIQVIEANNELRYDVTKDYSDSKVHMTKPIDDNLWYIEGSNVIYYDQSVVAALINYSSKWIDYVNAGDEAIFEFVKPESAAEQSILDLENADNTEKVFKLLQIGEIRQDDNCFYVWVYEEVEDSDDDKAAEVMAGVYELEIINDKMLISNYYSFQ